jgi:hypothetical protein
MKLSLTLAAATLAFGLATPSFAAPAFQHGPSFGPKPAAPIFAPAAYGKPQAWKLVGQTTVTQRLQKNAVAVPGQARFQQVMICAYNRPVRVQDLDVRFMNGGNQDLSVRNVLQPGSCTRAIDLNGNRRDIRAVTLTANTQGFGFARGLVKVFAR